MLHDFVCHKYSTKRILPKIWITFLFVVLGLLSCKKELDQIVKADDVLRISATSTDVVLKQKFQNNTAVEFTWTTGFNGGTNAAIYYTLELDKKGNQFASPHSVYLGKAAYSQKFTVKELNDILLKVLKFKTGATNEIEARVKAKTASDLVQDQVSETISVKVTTYKAVSETLYLIGEAGPNGWDNTKASVLTADANDPTQFTYQGNLKKGSFKFITKLGEWLPSYNKGADQNTLLLRTDFGQPDEQFTIEDAGLYKVVVNLAELTISVEKQAGPAYARIWIVGDATPNGWNIDNPNEMRVDPSDPFIFTYHEVLKAGEFKFPTSTGNWGADFYMPLANYQDLNNAGVQLVKGGSPDYKWKITTPGAYKITLNIREMTISIKPFTPYEKLWMVGDATPNGWNIDNPNPMVKDATNPYVFTYEGALKAGEFKIPTATGNWGTDYFMPPVAGQGTDGTVAKFITGGNPDNKWKITQDGNYKITLNQLYETIVIERK
jgi:starch-binding outer membrane protein SusE/F